MDVPVDASIELPPDIEPPNVLLVVSLKVVDDPGNAKAEDPPTNETIWYFVVYLTIAGNMCYRNY